MLDCTLRDGGYINQWNYSDETIAGIARGLAEAGMEFVEMGYINPQGKQKNSTQFATIEQIRKYLYRVRTCPMFLAMADAGQVSPEDLTEYTGESIEGIRVVFYKHQIEAAIALARTVTEKGYRLFLQPMVTIDYSIDEYARLIHEISALNPYAVSIVDSFGYMLKEDFRKYFRVVDNLLPGNTAIGFHSHNNMDLAFITAQDILEYQTSRQLIIDATLYGIGRGAGNLNTELIANYYNMVFGNKYDTCLILDLISRYIMPVYQKRPWGYSPYLFITALYHCHPNYACYLLDNHSVSVSDFAAYIRTIPNEMKTKCRKPYVLEMWNRYLKQQMRSGL